MLRTRIFVATVAALALLAACQKPAPADISPQGSATGTLNSVAVTNKDPVGVVLYHEAGLYEETSKGMEWKKSATVLDTYVLGGGKKEAIRVYDGEKRTFVELEDSTGKDWWIQDVFLAPKAVGAVVVAEDALVYNEPDLAKTTGTRIPLHQMVAVFPETEQGGFTQFSAYVDGARNPVITQLWIKSEKLTTRADDIRAMQLLTVAKGHKDAVVKKELLTNALSFNSVFSPMIQAELDALNPPAAVSAARATEAWPGTLLVIDSDVNVRDQPNEQGSTVMGQVQNGDVLTVTDRTVETYAVGGVTDRWYRVSQPEGWVFGGFVQVQ